MAKKNVLAVLGIAGLLASSGVAFARTTGAPTAAATQPMVLNVNRDGRVLLRGMVDAVSSGSVTVKGWGGVWTVNVGSSAKVLPQGAALTSFRTGDFVGVEGTVDQNAAWTVDATLVRDWTARRALNQEVKTNVQAVRQEMRAGTPRNVEGALSNLDTAGQAFTLTTGDGTAYSVTLASGAKVLAGNWTTLDFGKVNNGDTVRVWGPVASSTITASVFRDVSVE